MNYYVTNHAVERYIERCRSISPEEAKAEIERIVEDADLLESAPDWAEHVKPHTGALVLADVALILQGRAIVTIIVRGTIPPYKRAKRKAAKAKRKMRAARRRGL